MKFFDLNKARSCRQSKPILFWLSVAAISTILVFDGVFFILGILAGNIPLLLKGSSTLSIHDHPFGFFIVMIFDLLILGVMTSSLYLIISKTRT